MIKWATIAYVAPIVVGLGRKQALWDLPVGSAVVVELDQGGARVERRHH